MPWVFKQQRNSSTRYSIIILRDESHVIKWYFILMVQPITTITQCPDQYSSPCYATQNCFACIQSDSCEWNHSSKKCQAVKYTTGEIIVLFVVMCKTSNTWLVININFNLTHLRVMALDQNIKFRNSTLLLYFIWQLL